jgi:hypothetical protein
MTAPEEDMTSDTFLEGSTLQEIYLSIERAYF